MVTNNKNKKNNTLTNLRLAQIAISLGINFVIWSFAGYFLGTKLDTRFGTKPWLMILGILLGIALTFYGFIKEIMVLGDLDKSPTKDGK